ncbi:hypothetical protein [Engelhardtia mirabilis]|uniref:hypothetical protein n=1 Tax=Engelhardtia mirabilis TaxID=2528011 RepID=UPI00119CF0F6
MLPLLANGELVATLQVALRELLGDLVGRAPSGERGPTDPPEVPGLSVEHGEGQLRHASLEIGAQVRFRGTLEGLVLLRCSAHGAPDLARGLLLLTANCGLDLRAPQEVLVAHAPRVAGEVVGHLLDSRGQIELCHPELLASSAPLERSSAMILAYKLRRGIASVEVWLHGER